ncbi:hypothetical protein Tco_0385271 [Tanacetum coccineum]
MSNSNTNLQTQSSNALHNAIMEAGSKDRPPMLAPGNYVQWKSRIKRYIDTKPNSELIHYCLQNPPYTYQWAEKTVPVAEGSSETTTERYMENYKNVSQDIRDQLNAEAEAVQITISTPQLMLVRMHFGKFTSRDGESLESYYLQFYKMMNELVRNQCHVTNHQVNVQFLLQLQPEWQRFVTLVKQSQELKTVSYHKLYDILKQHQNEVNEIRTERLAQPITVTEDEEMSKEKEIDKLMALISLSFKKIYKPTNNNFLTSSNSSRANQDNSLRINRATGYDNQRTVNVARARENVGERVEAYDEFDMFTLVPGETIYSYYLRFAQLINNMHSIRMTWRPIQVNTKFINQGYVVNGARSNATGVNRTGRTNTAGQAKKVMLAEAPKSGMVLDEKHMAFLVDNGDTVTTGQQSQKIPTPTTFQTNDLDAFESDYDEAPSTSVVLMAKLSSYDSEVLSEVPLHKNYLENHVIEQNVQETQYSEQPAFDNNTYIDITNDSNMTPYEQYLKENENTVVQDTLSSAHQDAMIMFMIKEMNNQVAKCNKVDK